MDAALAIIIQALGKVWLTFTHNWPYLLLSILISVALRLLVKPEKISKVLIRYRKVGVVGATVAAVATPFCSCGTTAVILGMMASTIPWAPIVAFMVASPLTSPEGLVYSAGLFGWPFAIAFFVSSILLGLAGGMIADFCEARGWLANQARFNDPKPQAQAPVALKAPAKLAKTSGCSCQSEAVLRPALATTPGWNPVMESVEGDCCASAPITAPASGCGCSGAQARPEATKQPVAEQVQPSSSEKLSVRRWMEEIFKTGKQLLAMFLGFAFIGYLLNGIIPAEWVEAIFGSGNVYSIPLAATLGIPFYINSEGSLPLVRALIDGGMSQGAALAFLITGSGTSIGAVAGALTIARWRVIALVVGTLWVGSIALGYAYNLILAAGLF